MNHETAISVACDQLVHRLVDLWEQTPEVRQELQAALAIHDESIDPSVLPLLAASSSDGPESLETLFFERRKPWTVPELADVLNLSQRSLYDQIKNGSLTAVRIASVLRICPAKALAWYRKCVTSPSR